MSYRLSSWQQLFLSAGLVVMLFMAGCSGSSELAREGGAEFPNHSAQQIHDLVATGNDTLNAFSGNARLSVDAPAQSGSFNTTIRQKRGDSLFVSISPGFGMEAARMLVTPDSFYVYDRVNSQLAYGTISDAQAYLPVPLDVGDVFDNMLGLITPDPSISWQIDFDDDHYYLIDPDENNIYTVDPSRWRVIEFEDRTDDGELVEKRSFSDYTQINGVELPQRIEFERPSEDATATFRYRDLELNPAALSFDLGVRDNVQRIPFRVRN